MESPGHTFDLEAFKARIGYTGPLEPTLEVLQAIQYHHVCSIPFENLSILLHHSVELDDASLENKLIHQKRGGYCFEQNGLMLGILSQIGFDVTPMSGRVRLDRPRDFLPPRTHLTLKIRIDDQDWIYDAGVGSFSLTSPIKFELDIEQPTPHETRRIVKESGIYFHQAQVDGEWKDVYEFTGEAMPLIDREVSSWWTSTNPNAKFSQNLMSSLAQPNGVRKAILNDRFTRRRGSEILETYQLKNADHLLETLNNEFGLCFPAGTRFGEGEKPWPI